MVSRVVVLVLVLMVLGSDLEAQWQKISTPLVEHNPRAQVLTYKAGNLWYATYDTLWMTSDDGASWHVRIPDDTVQDDIQAVDFFDDHNGLLATKSWIYRTVNAGVTWEPLNPHNGNCYALKFLRSSQEIAYGTTSECYMFITTDGGQTWDTTDFKRDATDKPWDTSQYNFEELKDIQSLPNGTIKVLLLRKATGGSVIAKTHDFGNTWYFSDGFDYDCFSFDIDECDTNLMYVVNEEIFEAWDRMAMLYRSFDAGESWQSLRATPDLNYFTGSISLSPGGVVHVQTSREGIIRSIDNGNFWVNIGGPNGRPDTRLIVAVTDELIYGVDNLGRVWMTQNAGGYPAGNSSRTKLGLSKSMLFATQEGSICGDTLIDTLVLSYPECPVITFNNAAIEASISDYDIISQNKDTIIVRFIPKAAGKRPGSLVLTLNMATKQVIPLLGSGTIPDYTFAPSTTSLFAGDSVLLCDTIVRGLRIHSEGCLVPELNGQTVSGNYILLAGLPQVLTGDDSVTIAFAPRNSGLRTGMYTIRLADNSVRTISLDGYGIDPGADLTVSRSALFEKDSVALCTSASDTFVISSNLCIDRFVAHQSIVGPYSSEYTIERTIVNEFAGVDTIIIRFTPQALGLRNATFELVANDSSRIVIPLSGRASDEGYTLLANVTSLFDKDSATLCDSITRQFVITSSGCSVATVRTETIIGVNEYRLVSALPTTLTGADTVTIVFAPKATGLRSAAYELLMEDGKRLTVPLNGIGSDAPYIITVTPPSLFEQDSLFSCESVTRTITITKQGCRTVKIIGSLYTGEGGLDYAANGPLDSLTGNESITFEFKPTRSGLRQATYELNLEDGSTIVIPLAGFGKPTIAVSIATDSLFAVDVIGGEVAVPISIVGLDQPRSVEIAVTFDPQNLSYLGSRSINGYPLDLPGSLQGNTLRLAIPSSEVQVNGVTGYAAFRVYADSAMLSTVTFDNLVVTDAPLPCYYSTASIAGSEILGPEGCEVTIISEFLRTKRVPSFHIYPNPAQGSISIVTDYADDHAMIAFTNQLGIVHKHFPVRLHPNRPLHLLVQDLPSGLYFVRCSTSAGTIAVPLAIER